MFELLNKFGVGLNGWSYHWGEPERAPHSWIKRKFVYMYIYTWYVRIRYILSALFVRDAPFPHVMLLQIMGVGSKFEL